MKKTNINVANPRQYTREQLESILAHLAGVVKQIIGVPNNMAQVAMMNARDQLKKHPRYRQQVKKAFNDAFAAFDKYERVLLNPTGARYFHMDDMPEVIRKKYGNITDREYYEFWQNVGWSVYSQHRDFVTCLDNKFKLSLQSHGVPHAELLCQALTAEQILHIASVRYEELIKEIQKDTALPPKFLNIFFKCFDLTPVWNKWEKAMEMLVGNFPLTETESKNIENGISQLYDIIRTVENTIDGIRKSTDDYSEIFRTKGELKKVQKEIADYRVDLT